jgi:hypothetical protein
MAWNWRTIQSGEEGFLKCAVKHLHTQTGQVSSVVTISVVDVVGPSSLIFPSCSFLGPWDPNFSGPRRAPTLYHHSLLANTPLLSVNSIPGALNSQTAQQSVRGAYPATVLYPIT